MRSFRLRSEDHVTVERSRVRSRDCVLGHKEDKGNGYPKEGWVLNRGTGKVFLF